MAEIFVSYARGDRALVAPLVAALEQDGFSVWWDPAITPGQEFDQLISAELEAAKTVIVVWTPSSVESRWVRGEAREAADRGILIPVRFENARLPLDVRSLHTTDLDDWREDPSSAPFQHLLRAVRARLGGEAGPAGPTPQSSPRVRMTTIVSVDVAGYSARTETDQAVAARQIMALRTRLGAIAGRHGGRIFNTAGDSIMMEFGAAKEAVDAIFELLDDRPLSEPETRIGAHLGDVTVASSGDLLGHGVNVAARLMAQAQPGRALISAELKGALGHHADRPMRDVGELQLAKMESRVHAFEIAPASAASAPARASMPGRKRLQLGALAGVVLVVICALFVVFTHTPPHATSQPASHARTAAQSNTVAGTGSVTVGPSPSPSAILGDSASAKPRIAILPFENLSPDPNNAFFTDGMHEEILTALANAAPGLDVISRTTMMTYRDHPATIEQVAKDLNCQYVIEGSVRREGNEVRLTLQLINAKDDSHIWAQDYDRKLTSAMALQSEVAKEVAGQLSAKLAPGAKTAATPTTDPLAYDLYLKARIARQNLGGYSPIEDWNSEKALLDQAIKLDPNFVQAYVERFDLHIWLFAGGYDTSQAGLDLARADLDKAVALAPRDPNVIGAEAEWAYFEQDFAHALDLFAEAEAAGLTAANTLVWKAQSLTALGRFDESLDVFRRTVALDPANVDVLAVFGGNLFEAHQPVEASKLFDLAIARQPNPNLQDFRDYQLLGVTGNLSPFGDVRDDERFYWLRFRGHYAEARQILDATANDTGRTALAETGPLFGIPPTPNVASRGLMDLLLNDSAAAKSDGAALLGYARSQPLTEWSKWYMLTLEAEGLLLTGDKAGAIERCHQAIAAAPYAENVKYRPLAFEQVAPMLAWAGAGDEAIELLDQMSREAPGLPPFFIVGDPTISVPLANNPRYMALKARLEAQMADTAKLLGIAAH